MVEKWFFYHTWASHSVITPCHLTVNSKLWPNILWLASLPSFLAKDFFFVIDLLLRWVKTYKPYCSWYSTVPLTCFSILAIYFSVNFPLIAIFFFLDQSNIPIIFINKEMKLQYLNIELRDFDFMNGMLQYLNISLATWSESRMTREIQPVKDSSNSSMYFSRGLFRKLALVS